MSTSRESGNTALNSLAGTTKMSPRLEGSSSTAQHNSIESVELQPGQRVRPKVSAAVAFLATPGGALFGRSNSGRPVHLPVALTRVGNASRNSSCSSGSNKNANTPLPRKPSAPTVDIATPPSSTSSGSGSAGKASCSTSGPTPKPGLRHSQPPAAASAAPSPAHVTPPKPPPVPSLGPLSGGSSTQLDSVHEHGGMHSGDSTSRNSESARSLNSSSGCNLAELVQRQQPHQHQQLPLQDQDQQQQRKQEPLLCDGLSSARHRSDSGAKEGNNSSCGASHCSTLVIGGEGSAFSGRNMLPPAVGFRAPTTAVVAAGEGYCRDDKSLIESDELDDELVVVKADPDTDTNTNSSPPPLSPTVTATALAVDLDADADDDAVMNSSAAIATALAVDPAVAGGELARSPMSAAVQEGLRRIPSLSSQAEVELRRVQVSKAETAVCDLPGVIPYH